jgi:hypothetical protein
MIDEVEEAKKKAQEANSRRNTERLKLIEDIADASEVGRKDDIEGVEKEQLETEGTDGGAPSADDARTAESEAAPVVGDEKVVDGVTYYLTIVNGREKWLNLRQLRETASKVEAADEYLHQAKEAVKKSASEALSQRDEPRSLQKEEVRRYLAAVALGDESAIDALADVIAKSSGLSPDVLRALDQRMSFRTELASLEARSADLLKDEWMGRLFRSRLNEMKQEAPHTPLAEAYRTVDAELRKAFPGRVSKAEEKLERKRTLSQVPSAGARQSRETEDEGEEDPSVAIEKMAKARGVTPHLHRRQ